MAYNFRNVEQIFTKFGINHSLFILNIVPEFSKDLFNISKVKAVKSGTVFLTHSVCGRKH